MLSTRTTEVGLSAAVLMKDVVVYLTRTIEIREMNKPVLPSVRIVNRERAHVRCTSPERLEHELLGCPFSQLLLFIVPSSVFRSALSRPI